MKTPIRRCRDLPSALLGLALTVAPGTMADELLSPLPSNPPKTNSQVLAVYKKMSLEELMNQEVTSVAKQPEPYREAPAPIQIVTGQEIRRSGASSIPEALRKEDNPDVAQNSSAGWAISAGGFNGAVGDKLLVLMDRRSIYTPHFPGVLWNMQDYLLEDIDRIEVISGPGGTLCGANAVNGVINITSKSAKDTQGLYVETDCGTSTACDTSACQPAMSMRAQPIWQHDHTKQLGPFFCHSVSTFAVFRLYFPGHKETSKERISLWIS